MQEGSRTVLAMFQQDFSDFTARFQQGLTSLPAIFQRRSSKAPVLFRAFCWHHSPPQRLKPNRIAVGKLQQGSQEGSGRFQQGCSNVAARLQEGSSKFPARFQQDSRKVTSKVPARLEKGSMEQSSSKVPGRFQQVPTRLQARFRQNSSNVPARFPGRFKKGSSKVPAKFPGRAVPARFQEGSSKVALNSCKHVCRSLLLFKCVGCINIFLSCEKVHTVVAGSRFPSPNVKNTMFGPLFEVDMSKKCTRLWREAHFKVKSFGLSDVVLRGRREGLCTLSKVRKP